MDLTRYFQTTFQQPVLPYKHTVTYHPNSEYISLLYLENVHYYSLLDLIGWHVDELNTLVELPQRQSLRQGFKCMWLIWEKGIEEKTVNEEYIIK